MFGFKREKPQQPEYDIREVNGQLFYVPKQPFAQETRQPAGRPHQTTSYRDAIASIESAGSGDYSAVGPTTKTGDRAYGRYQVMGANIPEWTQAALGRAMTPQEFLQNTEAQDAVFDHRFGSYVQKYGPEGAANAWFAGEGGMRNPNARDVLGTSVADYAGKFTRAMGGMNEQYQDSASGSIPAGAIPVQGVPSTQPQTVKTLSPDEIKAIGLPAGTVAQRKPDGTISVVNKPDHSKPDGLPELSAGEAAAVRKQHKELKDALGAFKAFDQAVNETGNLVTAQFSAEERGRLGTAYNNARSYLRVLYNTGVLQPGELPMLEKALRDPTGVAAYDPRTRGEIQAQLGELYKLTARTFDNLVENYPQLYDVEKYRAVKAGQSAPPSGGVPQSPQSNRIRIKL